MVRKRSEVIGGNYFELFIPESQRRQVESQMNNIMSGGLPNRFENIIKSASGGQLNIEWTAHKQFDDKGDLTGIIAIGENITAL